MAFLQKYGWVLLIACAAAALLIVLLVRAIRLRSRTASLKEPAPDEARTARAEETLSKMITFKTVAQSDQAGEAFDAQLRYIRERFPLILRDLNASTVDGRGLLCKWKGADERLRPVLFCAHLDVVPAGEGWTHDPFGGTCENGYIYGRGAIDCKGPAVALLEAVESMVAEGFSPRRDVYFAIGHDEETGAKSSASRLANYFKEQHVEFEMVLDEGDYVQEDSRWTKSPAAFVGVAEKGAMNMRVTAFAKGGHASHPGAHNSAEVLAEAISRIESAKFRPRTTRTTRAVFRALAPYMTRGEKFLYTNLWLLRPLFIRRMCRDPYRNAILRTTAATTMVYGGKAPNVLPEQMEAIVNIRMLQGQTAKDVVNYYRMLLNGLDVELNIDVNSEASAESDAQSRYFRLLELAVRDKFGRIPVLPVLLASATDGRRYEQVAHQVYSFVPLRMTPEDLAGMHGPEERISREELGRAVEFYRDLIRDLQS